MTRNPLHPWAPAKRPKTCLDHQLDGTARATFARVAQPMPGCDCLWCIQAATPHQPHTLSPACDCDLCSNHLADRRPPHFLRVCSTHGQRWTPYDESDSCHLCTLGEAIRQCDEMLRQLEAA